MPKDKETSNHPCHFLSLPSAKRFWCRHCMSVFEDAITRWRHSRSCRYGVVNNFMRRRQLEAKALQNTTKPNPIEARLEHSVSPSEELISEGGPEPSGEKSDQATSNDLFRCFICHNKFSTLEEMRHHVKYPCNNKKIATDVPNPAMTVYIDEFTDRSRQWDPQPEQEEIISSELIPNIVSQETVHSTVDVKTEVLKENTVTSENKQSKLTPTNIYVNEQGETVIEVENLDLNSEGGELSLAHLLTQLSQQGIVFDKSKASHMQAQPEVTASDPASGEIYATGTSFYPTSSSQTIVKEEDEGQPTAEDAANTLAQLAVFRGYRPNPDTYEGPHMSTDLQREYVVEGSAESYTYSESYAISSASGGDQLSMGNTESNQNFKVEYDYNYLPSNQSNQMPLNSGISEEVGKEHDNIQSVSTMQVQGDLQPQVVTYISNSAAQQTQTSDVNEEAVLIQDYVVEESSSAVTPHQYHVKISDGIRQNESQPSTVPAMLEANHNSYIVFSTEDHSTQILCNTQDNQNELPVSPSCVSASILNNEIISNNHQQPRYIPESTIDGENMNEVKDTDEFEVQTVSLQEISAESTGAVSFVENHSGICTVQNSNVEISSANSYDLRSNETNDQCMQSNVLNQAANNIVHAEEGFTVAVEHQLSQIGSHTSESSSMPVYVVSTPGGLQLLATSQDGTQNQPLDHNMMPSTSNDSK